ncbi:hypothetical protein [Radicibacter daui]
MDPVHCREARSFRSRALDVIAPGSVLAGLWLWLLVLAGFAVLCTALFG